MLVSERVNLHFLDEFLYLVRVFLNFSFGYVVLGGWGSGIRKWLICPCMIV